MFFIDFLTIILENNFINLDNVILLYLNHFPFYLEDKKLCSNLIS